MAGTKISELTELTTPTGEEELVYAKDGQNGKIKVKNLPSGGGEVNTKSFYISGNTSSQTALDELTAANNWRSDGNNALLVRGGKTYTYVGEYDSKPTRATPYDTLVSSNGYSILSRNTLSITVDSSGNVTAFVEDGTNTHPSLGTIRPDTTYSNAFTPTQDSHPATKKYVDDLVGDIETLLANI